MATRTIVVVSDDLDGTEGEDVETVRFMYKGQPYAIDLGSKNQQKMDKDFEKWIAAARPERFDTVRRRGGRTGGSSRPAASKEQTKAMREYLRKRGHKVSSRGRIPQDLQDIYHNETRGTAPEPAAS